MVRLSGRHEALSAYVAAVFAKAVDVALSPPAAEITTLRDFFMAGLLCHKPPAQRLFTFDAFRFDARHHERLAEALAGSSAVSHAKSADAGIRLRLEKPVADRGR